MIKKAVERDSISVVTEPLGSDDNRLHKVFPEMLTIARQAIVEMGQSQLCVATINQFDSMVDITAPTPISSQDVEQIRAGISRNIGELGMLSVRGKLGCRINSTPEEVFSFHPKAKLQSQIVIPVASQGKTIGLLYIGSLDASFDLSRSKFIQHFSKQFARTLRHLWYLSSRQKEKFQLIVSRIFDGIILCDPRRRIQYVNAVAKRLLGAAPEQNWNGQHLTELEVPFLGEYLDEAVKANINEVNKVTNVPGRKADLIGVHLELLKNQRNTEVGWLIILRDVTKNWQNDQMRSAISIASHEIRTPLNSILGSVDLLLDKDFGDLNEKQSHCLNIVKDDISRLNRLLSDILDLSRFDEGIQFLDRRKLVALGFLVNKVIKSLSSFANSKNIRIENKIPRTLPNFIADRDRLQQVLANLIENSIKYSLPGGVVTIGSELKGNNLRFWVEDTGVGIPASGVEKVFERFVQLDNYPEEGRQGYGLGLSIAKEIVLSMDGTIEVDSEVGVGSTFSITLPI